ncbi:hypothetical protein ARMGADRAFT_1088401 [Armillaria gallica]|uniref:Uncharacterized protein n=1 Tax=Armillaria gallica TaxID=47427 RepID=A0A2H3D7R3_ARMGA|nr:hypothetical protein ARMGADRAFT_1088401 [Armillaria gallica]
MATAPSPSSPDTPYTGSVHEYIVPSSPATPPCKSIAIIESRCCHKEKVIPRTVLRPIRGWTIMNLDFAHNLSSVRVPGHEGCVDEAETSITSHRLPPFPWPAITVIMQSSGDRE